VHARHSSDADHDPTKVKGLPRASKGFPTRSLWGPYVEHDQTRSASLSHSPMYDACLPPSRRPGRSRVRLLRSSRWRACAAPRLTRFGHSTRPVPPYAVTQVCCSPFDQDVLDCLPATPWRVGPEHEEGRADFRFDKHEEGRADFRFDKHGPKYGDRRTGSDYDEGFPCLVIGYAPPFPSE